MTDPELPTWVGMRDEDLSPAERAARDAAPLGVRRAHADALALGARLRALPTAPPAPPGRPWVTGGIAAVAVAATLLMLLRPSLPSWDDLAPAAPMRARGGTGGPAVALHLVADGPGGAHALGPTDRLGLTDSLTVAVELQQPAEVVVEAVAPDGTVERVWPEGDATWDVTPGRTWLGGDPPLAWRPDHASAVWRLDVTACTDQGAACRTVSRDVQWTRR